MGRRRAGESTPVDRLSCKDSIRWRGHGERRGGGHIRVDVSWSRWNRTRSDPIYVVAVSILHSCGTVNDDCIARGDIDATS